MYTLVVALGLALFVALVPMLFGASAVWTVLPGLILGMLAFVWVNRRIAKRVEAVTAAADAEMANVQKAAARGGANVQMIMFNAIERSVELLKRGFIFQNWQIGLKVMLNARIGMLLYTRWLLGRQMGNAKGPGVSEAIPYLEKSRVRGRKAQLLAALWPAWAMLAVAYYKGKKDLDAAIKVLEETVKVAKKNGLLWSLYAWILVQEKRNDAAIDVLARGKAAAPDDNYLAENLTLLQNGKALKMKSYGEQWYQFGLEMPPGAAAAMQPKMGHPRMRGGMRRR